VIVAEYVADASYLRPWDLRVPGLEFIGQMSASFGNDLDASFDQPLFLPIGFKSIEMHISKRLMDPFDRFDNIVEMRTRGWNGHQNTSTAVSSMR